MSQPAKQHYEFGPFRLDPVERLLYRDGEVVSLTAKIFDILLVFVQNSGRTLEKEDNDAGGLARSVRRRGKPDAQRFDTAEGVGREPGESS
jgi:hypothetical protein